MLVRRLWPALLLLPALVCPRAASPAALPVEEWALGNGMRFLVVPRPQTTMVAAGWAARVGSGDESRGATGLSHLMEHLMFQGTRRVARPGEFSFLYTDAGAVGLDAATLRDLTFYYVTVPAEKLELWFWLESDRLRDPLFQQIGREKRIVDQERHQRIESTPTGPAEQRIAQAFWGDSPYAWRPLGRAGDLESLSDGTILDHFRDHYQPNRLTAVLVGRFDTAEVRRLAERYFGRLEAPRNRRPATSDRSFQPQPATDQLRQSCDCPPQARVLYPTVPFRHPDSYPLQLLAGLLNGRSGRLHRSLVLEQGLAFSASAGQHPLARAGHFAFRAESRGDTPPEALVAAWDRELERLLAGPIPEQELTKVRNGLAADALRRLEDPAALAKQLLIYDGLGEWREIEEWPRKVLAVDEKAVREAARRYLAPEQRMVALLERRPAAPADGTPAE